MSEAAIRYRRRRARRLAEGVRALLLAAVVSAAGAAHAARIVDLRIGSHPGHARVVIETDAPAAHEVVDGATPDEVIVRMFAESEARETASPAAGVAAARLEPQPDGTTLARIQATGPVRVETQVLSAPARLVVDLRRGSIAAASAPSPATPEPAPPGPPDAEASEDGDADEEPLVMPAAEEPVDLAAVGADERRQEPVASDEPPPAPPPVSSPAPAEEAAPPEPPPVESPPPPDEPEPTAFAKAPPPASLPIVDWQSVALGLAAGAGVAFVAIALARRRRPEAPADGDPAAESEARSLAAAPAPAEPAIESPASVAAPPPPPPEPAREREAEPESERELEPEPEDATLLDFVRMQNRLDRQLAQVMERLDEISERLGRLEAAGGAQVEELASHRVAIARMQRALRAPAAARVDPALEPGDSPPRRAS